MRKNIQTVASIFSDRSPVIVSPNAAFGSQRLRQAPLRKVLHRNDEAKQKAWMRVHQKRLLDNWKIEKLVAAIASLHSSNPELAEKIRVEADHFRRDAERMRHPKFCAQHLFVGSGVIEAGCKAVIGSRLKARHVLNRARRQRHPRPPMLPREGKHAAKMTRLSWKWFRSIGVRLWLPEFRSWDRDVQIPHIRLLVGAAGKRLNRAATEISGPDSQVHPTVSSALLISLNLAL